MTDNFIFHKFNYYHCNKYKFYGFYVCLHMYDFVYLVVFPLFIACKFKMTDAYLCLR